MSVLGNTNSVHHGLTAKKTLQLTVGRLPEGFGNIGNAVKRLRKLIAEGVVESGRDMGIYEMACIQSACRWEQHGLLAQRWLRLESKTMSASDRLNYSKQIAKASTERDKCLRNLGLDRRATNTIDSLLKIITLQPSAEPIDVDSDDEAISTPKQKTRKRRPLSGSDSEGKAKCKT